MQRVRGIIQPSSFSSFKPRAMYRVRFPRLGSLLGLLAILMVTLAPTVSQVLASHHRLSDALETYCSADVATPVQDGKPAHHAGAHWQVCPYCSLIAHVPTLPGTPVALAALLAQRYVPVAVAPAEVRGQFVHTAAQPRAPPVFS
jgi:hypothetical protein